MKKEWNVRVIASVQYYQDYIVEAKTKEEAEKKMEADFDYMINPSVQTWNEYHEGDNVDLRLDPDSTEDMEYC